MSEQAEPKPRRMSISKALEMALARGGHVTSSVTLARTPAGGTAIEVTARALDDETLEEVEQRAREVYDRLTGLYPPPDENGVGGSVELSRNAKGETQIGVTSRDSADLASAASAANEVYDRERARYPLASGLTTAAPESPAKGPKDGGKA